MQPYPSHTVPIHVNRRHSLLGVHPDAGAHGLARKRLIEAHAVDDDRLDRRRGVFDVVARRREELDGGKFVENGRGRQAEFLERLARQDSRAVDRLAGDLMFLEQCDAETGLCQLQTGIQSGWDTADQPR